MSSTTTPTKIPLVDLKAQFKSIESEIREAIEKIITNQAFIRTPEVTLFEEEFAEFCSLDQSGVKSQQAYCASCANGTDALEIALKCVGVEPGDEVITVSHTFFATAEAIHNIGGKPVFVDIDPKTYLMDPSKIEAKITSKTKAIVAVHLYGQPCDMTAIRQIANKHGLKVIEDAAQAHGAFWKGQRVGTLGDIASFSFFPGKNLGCYGDGGAVVSADPNLIQKAQKLANHGRSDKYAHDFFGRNSRLDALQAAVLRVKLRHLDVWSEKRNQAAHLYKQHLEKCSEISLPFVNKEAYSVWHLFVIQVQSQEVRDSLLVRLKEKGIFAGIHYPIPCHLQKPLIHTKIYEEDLKITEQVASTILSLPLHPEIKEQDVKLISQKIITLRE